MRNSEYAGTASPDRHRQPSHRKAQIRRERSCDCFAANRSCRKLQSDDLLRHHRDLVAGRGRIASRRPSLCNQTSRLLLFALLTEARQFNRE